MRRARRGDDAPRSRARRRSPIAPAWTFCFIVSACMAVQDYERAADLVRPHRGVRRPLRQPVHARLLPCGVRGHRPRPRPLGGGRGAPRGRGGGLARARPALAGGALAALAELRRRQGRPDAAAALLAVRPAARRVRWSARGSRSTAARPAPPRRRTERVLRGLPAGAALARAPALELLAHAHARPARGGRGGGGERRAARRRRSRGHGAVAAPAPTSPPAGPPPRPAATSGRRILLEDAADGFRDAGAPYERAEARRALAAGLDALGRHADAERERTRGRRRGAGAPGRGGSARRRCPR